MTIVVTGGGSGGHITPILAVAAELKRLQPGVEIVYIGQKGDRLADIPAADPSIDRVYSVRAGKFRRYHGEGLRQLLDVKTVLFNLRDAIYVVIGLIQSFILLRPLKPTVIFTRGGFVSVPVALGGKLNGVPYITHDSDALPSLANRLIARWADRHAVALPVEVYPYPKGKTVMTGIPINAENRAVDADMQQAYKQAIGIDAAQKLVLVTGGGNGAQALNQAVLRSTKQIVASHADTIIMLLAGRGLAERLAAEYDDLLSDDLRKRVIVKDFVTDFYRYSGAADLIIARGGATNLAEFAAQGKACVIVPSKQLIWNVKNTEVLAERGAVLALGENELARQPELLATTVNGLLADASARTALGAKLSTMAHPHAARELAQIILEYAR